MTAFYGLWVCTLHLYLTEPLLLCKIHSREGAEALPFAVAVLLVALAMALLIYESYQTDKDLWGAHFIRWKARDMILTPGMMPEYAVALQRVAGE
jgi:hypothetical protein